MISGKKIPDETAWRK